MSMNQGFHGKSERGWPCSLTHGFGVLLALVIIVGWAGTVSPTVMDLPAVQVTGSPVVVYAFEHPSLATITPTVTLTPTTAPPSIEEPTVYLPLIQKQMVIPGSLSIQEVYTADYDGSRQTTFRPCQALTLWIRMRNDADIPQIAILFWETQEWEGWAPTNLNGHRQVSVPPGESTWHFLGAPDLDAPTGEYRLQTWFTSGTDRQEVGRSFTVEGEPMPLHFLGGQTAAIDPQNYDLTVPREVVPRRVHANVPVRITDMFTFEDSDVVQITTWEGVRESSYVETHRFRPDGKRFGNLIQQWRDYALRPGCVRRALAYWPIDSWVKQTPGRWYFDILGDGQFVDRLYFTVQGTTGDDMPSQFLQPNFIFWPGPGSRSRVQ